MALLLDLGVAGLWWFQATQQNHAIFTIGIVIQSLVTLLLFVMTITYSGRRKSRFRVADGGYRPLTVGFGLIAFSFALNAVMVILYYLNIAGINSLIFTGATH